VVCKASRHNARSVVLGICLAIACACGGPAPTSPSDSGAQVPPGGTPQPTICPPAHGDLVIQITNDGPPLSGSHLGLVSRRADALQYRNALCQSPSMSTWRAYIGASWSVNLDKSPSQISQAGLKQVSDSTVAQADCVLLSDIENDLRIGATTFPTALRSGDWYMIQIVEAHEALHISHLTAIYTNAYLNLLTALTALTAATQAEIDAEIARVRTTFRSSLDTATDQEDAHTPENPFRDVQLAAAQPIFLAIARRRASLGCAGTPTTYQYTGNRFNEFSCEPIPGSAQACANPKPGQSSYTTDDFITIELRLNQRLPPNVFRLPLCLALATDLCKYDITATDGRQLLTMSDRRDAPISFSTDANGNIIAPWQVGLFGSAPPTLAIATIINRPDGVGSDYDLGWLRPNNFGRVLNRPGTWRAISR
jgi:hypothetical protein